MKKPTKREHLNLFFSAFLIIAFIICANFFSQFTATLDSVTGQLISLAVYAVFGLLLFYATRVGDGKAIKRFSPITLIVLVIPTLFIIVASLAPFMPFHDLLAANAANGSLSAITALSAVALGYGIPYTFLSGFERAAEDEEIAAENDGEMLDGGVEADVYEAQNEEDEEEAEEELDEASLQIEGDEAELEAKEDSEKNDESDESEVAEVSESSELTPAEQ